MNRSIKIVLMCVAVCLVLTATAWGQQRNRPDLTVSNLVVTAPPQLDPANPQYARLSVTFDVANVGPRRADQFQLELLRKSQLGGRPVSGGIVAYEGVYLNAAGKSVTFGGGTPFPGGAMFIKGPLEARVTANCAANLTFPVQPDKRIEIWIAADTQNQVQESREQNNDSNRLALTLP